ncbi:hypothetical protein DUNSADRAFT_7806 [Dunaliella salina]|uniref:Kinesin motor domain-containing protein n=1 Tax=Dunaliella salina TaxID=3046 RepID=A0ABQ7GKN5_DUNSA|nr:hypothetical protein DUNSADRAFT_7806 [Dunaliella salina]|eukprot:KAF5835177.1 hypothetical protein DUNSADRAFT_7806 [Dunaliella salina]
MADFMKSLRETPYGGSAKKPPSAKKTFSLGAGDADLAEAAAPHSNRKLQFKGSHTMTPNRPTQAPSRTTTPCVPPEAPLTIQRTPRQGSMGRRHDSGGEDKLQRDQEVREQQHDPYMSPRDSDDGCVNLDESTLEGAEGESVQVLVRIRPHNLKELQLGDDSSCLTLLGTRAVTCTVPGRDPRTFTFDNVLFGPQTEVFEVSGMPMVDNCMSGYNSSIFAYGQTGAGKTHTMLGQIDKSKSPSERGLAPRVFDYLFQKIGEEEDAKGRDSLRYSCRCSFLEIYNETITDLLNPSATNLQIREDTHGCFVEYLTETEVLNVDDVLTLMRHGAENRHTGETRLNRESSRSHSVFTCTVEKTSKASNGDSLGGNAKTQIIANVSPSTICSAETLSTLYFVQRAKCIRNKATINLDYSARGHSRTLTSRREEKRVKDLELKLSSLVTANNQFKRERERLEELMTSTQVKNKELQDLADSLSSRVDNANSTNKKMAAAERNHLEHQIAVLTEELEATKAMLAELQASADAQSQEAQEAQAALDERVAELQQQKAQLQADHASEMAAHKQAADAEMQELQERLERVEQERGSSSLEAMQLQEQLEEVEAAKEAAAEMVEDQRQHIGKLKQDLDALQEESSTSKAELQASLQSLTHEKASLEQASAKLSEELQGSQGEGAALREQLGAAQGRVVQLEGEVQAGVQGADNLQQQLRERQEVVVKLEGQVREGEQGADALQRQLDERREEVVMLEGRVKEGELSAHALQQALQASREEVARLEGRVQEGKEGSEGLQQRLAESLSVSSSLAEQLQQLAGSLGMSSSLVEQLQAKEKGQLAEDLADSQASGARLAEELQGSRAEAARLAEERAQLSEELGMTKGLLAAREEQVGALRGQLESTESQANSLSQQVATQQKEIEDKQAGLEQEEYVVHEYELKGVAKGLEDELEALRKDQAQAHALLESKDAELAHLQRCLAEQGAALEKAQAAIAAREKELQELQASTKEAMAKAQQLHESEQAYIRELQKELNAFKLGRGDMEQQMKNFLITNTRQGRAFTEIRRLIEWATTPPSSARASISTRNQGGAPRIGGAENGGGGSPATAAADETAAEGTSTLSPSKVSAAQMGGAPTPDTGDEEVGYDVQYQELHSDGGSNNGEAEEQPVIVQREQSQPSYPPSGHKWNKRGETAVYSDVDSPLDQAVHAQHI